MKMSTHAAGKPSWPEGLPNLVIRLLKGIVYRDENAEAWNLLLGLQRAVRDHMAVLGLELEIDEAEGYAFLRSRPEGEGDPDQKLLRLIPRRPLSYQASLLLALLRKKLAEFDATGGDTRLILTRDDVADMLRIFLPDNANEAKLIDRLDTPLNQIVNLGFLRKLGGAAADSQPRYEIQRILKVFVTADHLDDLDQKLAEYRSYYEAEQEKSTGGSDD